MLLSAYDFVDPGVYGEDENANWSIDSGFPDWDGDGIGEGYEFVKVTDRSEMETCSYQGTQTPLKIHVYSVLETMTLEQLQGTRKGDTDTLPPLRHRSPIALITKGYAFTDSGKEGNASRLTNLNGTLLTSYTE